MATESVDEILDKLVDYVGAGVGNMTRKKTKAALDAYYTRECARKVLEGRVDEWLRIDAKVDFNKKRNKLRAEQRQRLDKLMNGDG